MRISLISNNVKQKLTFGGIRSVSMLVKFGHNPCIFSAIFCFKWFGFVPIRHLSFSSIRPSSFRRHCVRPTVSMWLPNENRNFL